MNILSTRKRRCLERDMLYASGGDAPRSTAEDVCFAIVNIRMIPGNGDIKVGD
jgi:hypothetical protein